MAARKGKKQAKITKAPSGASFMYAPREAATELRHVDCGGIVSDQGANKHPGANRPDARTYACGKCGREWPSGEFQHEPTVRSEHHVVSEVVKRQAQKKMPTDLRDAVRAEVKRRMEILAAERAKLPSSFITYRKKNKKGKLVRYYTDNPKFTEKMRQHMHRFYVDATEIHDALKDGRELPEFPVKS